MASTMPTAEASAATDANIKALEGLLEEFFRDVSNERKAEIERLLSEFSQQSSSWRDSLVFLNRSGNAYVSMFSLNTIENTIRKRWVGMPGPEKTEIRTQLHAFLAKNHSSAPAYIRNKVIKLLVDIATTDWPHFYPTFFTDITAWIHGDVQGSTTNNNGSSVIVGLSFLLTTSEELATPRDNISSARKEELKRLLTTQVPQMISSLSSLLESLLPLFRGGATSRLASTTPPPSPSPSDSLDHDEDSSSGDSSSHNGSQKGAVRHPNQRAGVGTSNLLHVAKDLLNQEVSSLGLHGPISSEASVEITTLALRCLAHLFTWVPLTTVISPRLLASVFHFAGLAIPENGNGMNPGSGGTEVQPFKEYTRTQLSILAMSTINEIMYRHCVPADFESFLLQMFQNTFQLLQMLVQPINTVQGTPPTAGMITYQLQTLDESYLDKFTEFIHSFVQSHLRRFENSLQFPINDFLALLYKYTFGQPRTDGYMACLDIWCTCVDFVSGTLASTRSVDECAVVLSRYREAFTAIVNEILKKLQFRFNSSALEEMDDDKIDDDEETEWQHYLRASIETILRVSDVLPEEVLGIVDVSWKETSIIYLQLEKYVQQNAKRLSMASGSIAHSEEIEFTRIHHLLRDFASLLQIIGRLSVLFTGGNIHDPGFCDQLRQGLEIVRHLIELASFGSRAKLYSIEHCLPEVLTSDFVQAHAQTLAALKAWCHWLSQLHKLSLEDKSYETECKDLIARIMVAVSPVLKDQSPGRNRTLLVHSAAHFLVTLTGSVRPPSIWKLKEFTELYSTLPHLVLSESEDHRLMVRALSNVLLLPWPGIPDQRWDERRLHLTKFLNELTGTLRNVRSIPDFASNKNAREQAKPGITHTLRLIKDLCDNVREEGNATKKLCHDCISEYVQIVLWLLPIYVNNNSASSGTNMTSGGNFDIDDRQMCEEAFTFFHIVLDVLKSQMGAESVNQVVHTVLTLFTRDQLAESVVNDGGAGTKIIEKLLGILQLVVKQTDSAFKRFIDSSLTLCLDQIYPMIAEKQTSDIKGPLYAVLYHVLLYNWRYFFKSSMVTKGQAEDRSGQSHAVDGGLQEQGRFISILQAFGQSFLQADISIFKQNLAALEDINSKWRLYHKPVFTQHLIVQFLTVLLQVLVNNSHNLLKEEITQALYNMASVDFGVFFNQFLIQFLDSQELDSNQKQMLKTSFKTDTDLPTFNSNMNRFIGDIKYYKTCNASLPVGSVKFSV